MQSLGISGFELGPHYCQLPVADEVQPDRNSYPAVLTVVWIVFDSIPGKPLTTGRVSGNSDRLLFEKEPVLIPN